nr:peroxidase 20 [Tanacetum cinerariifolium]
MAIEEANILWRQAAVRGAIVILPKLGVPYPFSKPYMEQVVILAASIIKLERKSQEVSIDIVRGLTGSEDDSKTSFLALSRLIDERKGIVKLGKLLLNGLLGVFGTKKHNVKRSMKELVVSNTLVDLSRNEYSWRKYRHESIKGSPHPRKRLENKLAAVGDVPLSDVGSVRACILEYVPKTSDGPVVMGRVAIFHEAEAEAETVCRVQLAKKSKSKMKCPSILSDASLDHKEFKHFANLPIVALQRKMIPETNLHYFDVHNDDYFFHLPLAYVNGVILKIAIRKMPYEQFVEYLEEKSGNYFQGLYYQVPNQDLERGLVRVSDDRSLSYMFDVKKTFDMLNLYLDHLDMNLLEYLSQPVIYDMDACISKIIGPLKKRYCNDFSMDEMVDWAEMEGVKARTSTINKGKNKVSQDATEVVKARRSMIESDYASEYDSDDDNDYQSDNVRGENFKEHDIYMNEFLKSLKTADKNGITEDHFISIEKHVERLVKSMVVAKCGQDHLGCLILRKVKKESRLEYSAPAVSSSLLLLASITAVKQIVIVSFDIFSKGLSRSLTCKRILPPWKQARKIYYWGLISGIRACGELLKRRIYRYDLKPFLTNFKEKPNLISLSKMSDHEDETINEENAPPKVVPQITTVTNISTKFHYLKKGEYDIWAMKMQNFISSFDLLCWNIVLKGNSAKSMTTDKDGNLKIRHPVTTEEHQQNFISSFDLLCWNIVLKGNNAKSMTTDKDGHFSRECRAQGGQNSNNYQKYKDAGKDGTDSKAIVVVDGSIDWDKQTKKGNTEPRSLENFGMVAGLEIASDADSEGEVVSIPVTCPLCCDSKYKLIEKDYHEQREQLNDCVADLKAHKHAVKSLEKQIKCHQTNQLAYEEKIRVLSYELEEKSNILKYRQKLIDQATHEKQDLMTKLDNELANQAKWNNSGKNLYKLIDSSMSVRTKRGLGLDKYIGEGELGIDDFKVVPPPLTGNYMPPSNIPDMDESHVVYGKKATDSSEIKTNYDIISHSHDSVLFDFSYRSSKPSTNDFQTYDSSQECSRPNNSDHDSNDSNSSVSAHASESSDIIVIDCARQEDFPSVCSIETDVKSSKPLCNKFGSFNKERHFRKHKSVAFKSCYVCGSYIHLIKYCDFHEQTFAKRNAKGKGILKSRPTGKPVNQNRTKPVSAGRPDPVSAG